MKGSISRRNLIKAAAVAALGTSTAVKAQFKPLRSSRELRSRGEPEVYSGQELKFIGMPVGGLFAGTLYLGGDGQLWNWDIFNEGRFGCIERPPVAYMGDALTAMGGANYVDPQLQRSPFRQRFELVDIETGRPVRFGDIRFRGEYPVGRVRYGRADTDVEMSLEAFSPFCPLDAESSSHPATTLTFRVKNLGKVRGRYRMRYQLQNPVLALARSSRADFKLATTMTGTKGLYFSAARLHSEGQVRPDTVFEDWSSGSYRGWVPSGTAFGKAPRRVSDLPAYMGPVHAGTEFVVNTHETRSGEDVVAGDAHLGSLRSPKFAISRRFINLRVGGGNHRSGTCVNLVVESKVVRSCTGRNSNVMNWESFEVSEYEGADAHLEVVDNVAGGWGQVSLGEVVFSDSPKAGRELESLGDFGTFCVELVEGGEGLKADNELSEIGATLDLQPGEERSVTFVVAWHFPNCAAALPGERNWYATRWRDAAEVAGSILSKWRDLQRTTLAWNQTWYDSTLPYWFLDRTFLNTSILATTTCHRLDDGRYYFWEGVGCCPGTCTHVWGYAQAIGRVFPEVERYLRQQIDFGRAFRKETGAIDYRAEFHEAVAHDGQASCILRAYREHQMAPSDAFLRSIWPQVKCAMEFLIREDRDQDGILEGAQYNTLDTSWHGPIAWISSLYIAALRACEQMGTEMGDREFAEVCARLAVSGSAKLVSDLYNGEYFVNRADAAHPEANNTNIGCHIDQIYGQAWALQVGLPRIVPSDKAKSALRALMKHNFHEDVWEYRRRNKAIPGGRWYAVPQEAGLLMCTFPRGGAAESVGKGSDAWAVGYFNECMSGFEYQAASHMIAEGMVDEGLRVVRAIHERYHPSKRNPYNEVECSDHYGRAMASYGAFVAITGFLNDGPRGYMRHQPQVMSSSFHCAFINERGWGTYHRSESAKETISYCYRVKGSLADDTLNVLRKHDP